MRLTLYTDYTLRVMMYLAVKYTDGSTATIDEMARAYAISRSNLTKIVNELAQNGFIETIRGRTGGMRLARPPAEISIGALVRLAEKDFGIVECHAAGSEVRCAILPACNLRHALRRAVEAFLREIDNLTLRDAIASQATAASLLQIQSSQSREVAVPIPAVSSRARGLSKSSGRVPSSPATQAQRKSRPSRRIRSVK